jgi:predicted ABC-type exoprotein transport system permease subunit
MRQFLISHKQRKNLPLFSAVLLLVSSFSLLLLIVALSPITWNVGFGGQEWCKEDDLVDYYSPTLSSSFVWQSGAFIHCGISIVMEFALLLRAVSVTQDRLSVTGDEDFAEEDPRLPEHSGSDRIRKTLKGGLLFIVFPAMSIVILNRSVSWLYDVSSNSDSRWDFGQIIALAGVVLDMGRTIGKHMWENVTGVEPPTRRYKIIWGQSCISFRSLYLC